MSVLIVGLVSAAAGYGTMAYFNDTETAQGNTLETGTISMNVDGQAEWTKSYEIGDIKPSFVRWINFTVTNDGDNEMVVWKHVNVTDQRDGLHPEPEPTGADNRNDLAAVTEYDLSVDDDVLIDPVSGTAKEVLYLSDSGLEGNDGNGTELFSVDLNENTGRADLTKLTHLAAPTFDQVDAIASTPDGEKIYALDKDTTHLGVYDTTTDTFTDLGDVSGIGSGDGAVLAGFSPDGTLYAAGQDTDELYTIDIAGTSASSIGAVSKSGGGTLDISGADLVFGADGALYIWVNSAPGLWVVPDIQTDNTASFRGSPDEHHYFTGLAIRAAGAGDLVASTHWGEHPDGGNHSPIWVVDKSDASTGTSYNTYHNGSEYMVGFGDMSVGVLGEPVTLKCVNSTWVKLGTLEPGESMNVSQSYHMMEEAGNEYQGDNMTFDIELAATQTNAPAPGPVFTGCPEGNCTTVPAPSESPDQRMNVLSVDSSQFPKIYSNVHVDTEDGRGGNLTREDFEVYEKVGEDWTKPEIESFNFTKETTTKADVIFAIDTSGSMGNEISTVKDEVENMTDSLDTAGIDARYSLVLFGEESNTTYTGNPNISQGWTDNASEFKSAVDNISTAGGIEPNYDAIHMGMDQGFRNGSQKVVLDFTDEPSNGDTHNRSETVNRLVNEGVTYVAISENRTGDPDYKKQVAADVGGVWIDIDTAPFDEALDQITGILTSQYTIDWTTCATESDGTTRDVRIFVDDPNMGKASDDGSYAAPGT